MLTDITRGALTLKTGFNLILKPGIRQYAIVPLLINVILFSGLIWFTYVRLDPLVQSIVNWLPDFLQFMEWLVWFIVTLAVIVITVLIFTPVANIIGAPFNAIMSEKIEALLTGKPPVSNATIGQIIVDSVTSQIRKLGYILPWTFLLLLISFIPVINIISPVLWILFGSWLLSLEYLDYPMGNHDIVFQKQKEILSKRRGLSLGFGSAVMVMTSTPILNFIVMPIAVAGATVLWSSYLHESSTIPSTISGSDLTNR